MLPPKYPKCGLTVNFFIKNESQLQSNKVCYKVSLYENFHWQSCSTTILVSNGP